MVQKIRFTFENLVRDQMLNIWKEQEISVVHQVLSNNNYKVELKKKLLEEAEEVADSKSKEEVLEELADVLEVLLALGKSYNFSLSEIDTQRLEKLKKRGGFEKKLYCHYVEMVASDKNQKIYQYFLDHPDRYPQESF